MTKDLELKLVAQYPVLFQEYGGSPSKTCMAWGCSHGDGWFDLLVAMCAEIQEYVDTHPGVQTHFLQVKEKFAGLRVYHHTEGGDSAWEDIEAIINKYYNPSITTCEVCGQPGKMVSFSHLVLTRCPAHETSRG